MLSSKHWTLEEDDEEWLSFGTGKAFRFLAAHEMARALGPEKAQAHTHVSCLNRVRHGLLLCRTWQEDGMGSVDSST